MVLTFLVGLTASEPTRTHGDPLRHHRPGLSTKGGFNEQSLDVQQA